MNLFQSPAELPAEQMRAIFDSYELSPEDKDYVHNVLRAIGNGPAPNPHRLYVHQVRPIRASIIWDVPWGRVHLSIDGQTVALATMLDYPATTLSHNRDQILTDVESLLQLVFSHPDLDPDHG